MRIIADMATSADLSEKLLRKDLTHDNESCQYQKFDDFVPQKPSRSRSSAFA